MLPEGLLAQLDAAISDATLEDLPALAGRLRQAELLAEVRLRSMMPTNGDWHQPAAPDTWFTPEQAAAIAGVPKERIYVWAKGKRWASRPSRRCLRISEAAFRRWLAARP